MDLKTFQIIDDSDPDTELENPLAGPMRFRGTRAAGRAGLTMIELVVVLILASLTLGIAALYFGSYYQKTSARRAAQVFAQDLTLARASALRARQPVVIRFDVTDRWYSITMQQSGTELERRRFKTNADISLSAINLETKGDSLVFSSRGEASLKGGTGSVGTATFTSGDVTYTVSFNSMGASKVQEN